MNKLMMRRTALTLAAFSFVAALGVAPAYAQGDSVGEDPQGGVFAEVQEPLFNGTVQASGVEGILGDEGLAFAEGLEEASPATYMTEDGVAGEASIPFAGSTEGPETSGVSEPGGEHAVEPGQGVGEDVDEASGQGAGADSAIDGDAVMDADEGASAADAGAAAADSDAVGGQESSSAEAGKAEKGSSEKTQAEMLGGGDDPLLVNGGVYLISTALSGSKVIDISGGSTSNYANAQLYQSNDTLAQYYIAKWLGSGNSYTFINVNSGKALDVSGGEAKRGANVQQYKSNGTAAQKWTLVLNADGSLTLVSGVGSNMVLDVSNGSSSNGANLQLWTANGTVAQRFMFTLYKALTEANSIASSKGQLVKNEYYNVVSGLSEKMVLDISGASVSSGANVQIYTDNSTYAQVFSVSYRGNGLYAITNANSGKALDVSNGSSSNGANIQQYASNNTLAQLWYFVPTEGGFVIKSAKSGKALNVAGGKAVKGANVEQYTANASTSEVFFMRKLVQLVANGTYVIQTCVMSPMVLDVASGSTSNGANVQTYRSNGTKAQQFVITYVGEGAYTVMNKKSGLFLDVAWGSTANGGNIHQYAGNGSDAQKWVIEVKGGSYMFKSVLSGKYLDVAGASKFRGANIQQYSGNGSSAQRFNLMDGDWSFYKEASSAAVTYIEYAEQYEGWPYEWGGRSPSTSFDCAGLVMYCANKTQGTNFDLTYTNAERLYGELTHISSSEAKAGDIVFFRGTYGDNVNYISHVMIYCGEGVAYGAGDPIGYSYVTDIKNINGKTATAVYARL